MNYTESLEKLFSLHQFGIKLGLENIRRLLDEIGNPQKQLKTFHIAGSNGKGSTASFISSILTELGFRTGLYTSPHLIQFNERISIEGSQIPNDYIVQFVNQLNGYIDKHSPTFFELTTAMAFKYFAEQNVDYAVIETGLGGRLDATNVLNSLASVITSISLEHTNILGNDIRGIAREKAAIIKPNSKVFIGNLMPEIIDVFQSKALESNSEFHEINLYSKKTDSAIQLSINDQKLNIYHLPIKGEHQYFNAALAVLAVIKTLEVELDEKIISGLNKAVLNSGFKGRYQFISESPKILIDAAHNPESLLSFISIFKNEYKKYKQRKLIFGAMKDKDIRQMIDLISIYFDEIYTCKINYERAALPNEIILIGKANNLEIDELNEPAKFIENYINTADKNDCLVILGSIYLVGDILKEITDKKILTL